MKNKTLLTPLDVVTMTDVKLPFNPCTFRDVYQVEYREARTCLGGLYEAMVDALADYSTFDEWSEGTNYIIDDIVSYSGLYYIAITDNATLPTSHEDWEIAPRFSGDCAGGYDTLFCNFLGPYLAAKVLISKLPKIWQQITDVGVIEIRDGVYKSSDPGGYNRVIQAVRNDADLAWENFIHYMGLEASEADSCFADYHGYTIPDNTCGCGTATCPTCNPRRIKRGAYDFG